MIRFLLFALCIMLLGSCRKEKPLEVNYTEIQIPTEQHLFDLVANENHLWAASGRQYAKGAVWHSDNNGIDWEMLLDSDTEIRTLFYDSPRLYASPIGNLCLWSDDGGQSWDYFSRPGWELLSGSAFLPNGLGLLVGGENFGYGILQRVEIGTGNNQLLQVDTLTYELQDVHFINDSVCIAVGNGVILRSTDSGLSWTPDQARGDFFRDLFFVDTQIGFVVGYFGAIYKTEDGGLNWKKIRTGTTVFNSKNRIRAVCFFNAQEGVIVGERGFCQLTQNGGKSWYPINNMPDITLYSVLIRAGKVYIGAEQGRFFIFDWPF